MKELTILNVVGCRPNFVKIAPLMAEMRRHPELRPILVHTGQHYDASMSDVFFRDLDIPRPEISLCAGSASPAATLAQIASRLEEVLSDVKPDLVLVVGDVNSTLASAVTAKIMGFPVAHVEAGLRSFDRDMPEEINRVATDAIADLLFTTEASGVSNLLREGKSEEQVFFSGNVMIDSLLRSMERIDASEVLERFALTKRAYALVTLHRPSNVDTLSGLSNIVRTISGLQELLPIVFPVHPRTANRLEQFEAWERLRHLPYLHVIEPLGYLDFIKLMKESALVLTDSGGVQEESTALGVPCLTMRKNTERPVTITSGTNRLVGTSPERILENAMEVLHGGSRKRILPEKWDGHAAERIVSDLLGQLEKIKSLARSTKGSDSWPSRVVALQQ